VNILSHKQPTKGDPPAWELGKGLTTSDYKTPACYETLHNASELLGSCQHGNETSGSIEGGEFLD
jgi:hypothetical protein